MSFPATVPSLITLVGENHCCEECQAALPPAYCALMWQAARRILCPDCYERAYGLHPEQGEFQGAGVSHSRPNWPVLSELRGEYGREYRPVFLVLKGQDREPWVGVACRINEGREVSFVPQDGDPFGLVGAIEFPREAVDRIERLRYQCCLIDGCLSMSDPLSEREHCADCASGFADDYAAGGDLR